MTSLRAKASRPIVRAVRSVLTGAAVAFLSYPGLALGGGLRPILPIQTSLTEIPMLHLVLRDPSLVGSEVGSPERIASLQEEIRMLESDLSHSKGGSRKGTTITQLLRLNATLAYLMPPQHPHLSAARQAVVRYAGQAGPYLGDRAAKSTAAFHALVAQYWLNAGNDSILLASARKLRAANSLPGELSARLDLLQTVAAIRSQQAASFRSVTPAGSLLPGVSALAHSDLASEGVVANFAAAQALSGIALGPRRIAKTQGQYETYLRRGVAQALAAADVENDTKMAIVNFALSLWTATEGGKANWRKSPIKSANLPGSPLGSAIAERVALEDWKAGKTVTALAAYERLARETDDRDAARSLWMRTASLHSAVFNRGRNVAAYEGFLMRARSSDRLDDGSKANFKAMHQRLVDAQLRNAGNARSPGQTRMAAISFAMRFRATLDGANDTRGSAELNDLDARIAHIYTLLPHHGEAVAIYRQLAERDSANAARYLTLAIISQSILAQWPRQIPWNGIGSSAGVTVQRGALADIYGKLIAVRGAQADWELVAHRGYLLLACGRGAEALTLWRQTLNKEAKHPHAARIAGFMLATYERTKNWEAVEDLARLALKERIAPSYRGRSLPVTEMFATALIEQGSEAHASKKWDIAKTKLQEFLRLFPNHKRADQGMSHLADALYNSGKARDGIVVMQEFVQRFPSSKYYRSALLRGGDWSVYVAFEDNVIFFYSAFLKKYSDDSQTKRVRGTLLDLYKGRAMYAGAREMLQQEAADKKTSPDERLEARTEIVSLEDRQGNPDRAVLAARQLLSQSNATDAQKATAYLVIARNSATARDAARQLAGVEASLGRLDNSLGDVQEARGEVRYALALWAAKSARFSQIDTLTLTDPMGELFKQYAVFDRARRGFDGVCEVGRSSFCVSAMQHLMRTADEFRAGIDKIQINPTLPEENVKAFTTRKGSVIAGAKQAQDAADRRIAEVADKGYTNPDALIMTRWRAATGYEGRMVEDNSESTLRGNEAHVQWEMPGKSGK